MCNNHHSATAAALPRVQSFSIVTRPTTKSDIAFWHKTCTSSQIMAGDNRNVRGVPLDEDHLRLEPAHHLSTSHEHSHSHRHHPRSTHSLRNDTIPALISAYSTFCDRQISDPQSNYSARGVNKIITDEDKKCTLILVSDVIDKAMQSEKSLAVRDARRASGYNLSHLDGFDMVELTCQICSGSTRLLIPKSMAVVTKAKVRTCAKEGHTCK